MDKRRTEWLIPVLLALGAAGALWYYWMQVSRPPPAEPVAAPQMPAEEPQAMPGPVHPVPEPGAPRADRPQLVPLPPLDRSDEYFRLALSDLLDESIDEMLVESGLIERIVATIDNLPRTHVAERIRPVGRLGGQFQVNVRGGDEFIMDSSNYDRYVPLVDVLTGADLRAAAEMYRRFYPLFQDAYVDLGYPQGYFNDRLVEVIDHLLGTPEVDDSVPLVRPHVLYEFADPDLEELSSGQKLLIRMGSDNRSRVKAALREFRSIVTQM